MVLVLGEGGRAGVGTLRSLLCGFIIEGREGKATDGVWLLYHRWLALGGLRATIPRCVGGDERRGYEGRC